jgi:hypothetical protein
MFNLSQYLNKAIGIGQKNLELKKVVLAVLSTNFNSNLDEKSISFKNGVLTIKTNPTIKTELFIKKNRLIKEMNSRLGENLIFDIR